MDIDEYGGGFEDGIEAFSCLSCPEVKMPITVRDRYKEIFQAHRSASEYRLKILAAWGGGSRNSR